MVPEFKVTDPPASTLTVEVPAVKVPFLVKRVLVVPVKVMVEPLAVKVPPVAMSNLPVLRAKSDTPLLVLKFEVA